MSHASLLPQDELNYHLLQAHFTDEKTKAETEYTLSLPTSSYSLLTPMALTHPAAATFAQGNPPDLTATVVLMEVNVKHTQEARLKLFSV